ncbi:MAG: glucose 1-dehydrogenase [Pseudomonadota bacterium]|nr:glucose 1-dehydrogenase [Pseudomonadota bacterium]
MSRMAGKIVMVTGGASGLGEAMCRRYAEEGATVWVCDVDDKGGRGVAESIGGSARFLSLDVTLEAAWLDALKEIKQRSGRLDVLVNNAGITMVGSIESLSLHDFRVMLDIDLVGVFLGCKHVIPMMKEAGGSVINMASMCSIRAQHDLAGYNAAKAAVAHLTKSAALYYARQRYGIRCNSIHPGVIKTPILEKVMSQVEDRQAIYAGWEALHPLGRMGQPGEVAALAVYLGSDESAFATGAEFVLDGGSIL